MRLTWYALIKLDFSLIYLQLVSIMSSSSPPSEVDPAAKGAKDAENDSSPATDNNKDWGGAADLQEKKLVQKVLLKTLLKPCLPSSLNWKRFIVG